MSEQEAISEFEEELERLQTEVDAVRERRRRNWAPEPDARTLKERLLDELNSVSEKILQTHDELLVLLAKEEELAKRLHSITSKKS